MEARIPEHHPLRQFFGVLTERSFAEDLNWPDFQVTDYVSNLLVEFAHVDTLHKIRTEGGDRVDTVADLLYESEVLHGASSLERERDVHRHIGDFTLFMAGLFPEYLTRLKTEGLIYHKDFLVDYVKAGKRSYGIVAELDPAESDERPPVYRRLSENFELCVAGVGFVRRHLDRLQDPIYRQAKTILLN